MTDKLDDRLPGGLIDRAMEALRMWSVPQQQPQLLKYRENAVFRVTLADGKPAALRLHRPGYHQEEALLSELQWMAALQAGGLHVPAPVPAEDGRFVVELLSLSDAPGQYADIVTWMHGEELGRSGVPLSYSPERLVMIFGWLGEGMAELHNISDRWSPPPTFVRPSWNAEGLLGETPFWGRFWDCTGLPTSAVNQLANLRLILAERLESVESSGLDYGLIHADLVRENVLVCPDHVEFIDFDDAGYGWRMFDIATALLRNRHDANFDLIRDALVAGYRNRRSLSDADLATLPLFMLLRSLTYIGWIGQRRDTPDAARRLGRYVKESIELAAITLDKR